MKFINHLCVLTFTFILTMAQSYAITASNTGGGTIPSLGIVDSNWYLSSTSAVDLSSNAYITYPNAAYSPSYPTNALSPGFNPQTSRFLGSVNNSTAVSAGDVSDPAGVYYFNTVVTGSTSGLFFSYETDNYLTNILVNGNALFSSAAALDAYLTQPGLYNPANSRLAGEEFHGFNGTYILPELNAGDILSFEISNLPGDPFFGDPLGFRAEFVTAPEPTTYALLATSLILLTFVGKRRKTENRS